MTLTDDEIQRDLTILSQCKDNMGILTEFFRDEFENPTKLHSILLELQRLRRIEEAAEKLYDWIDGEAHNTWCDYSDNTKGALHIPECDCDIPKYLTAYRAATDGTRKA